MTTILIVSTIAFIFALFELIAAISYSRQFNQAREYMIEVTSHSHSLPGNNHPGIIEE